MMTSAEAEREIIREWKVLPQTERKLEEQAVDFAMKIKDKYKFECDGDHSLAIIGFIRDYQIRIGIPLSRTACL